MQEHTFVDRSGHTTIFRHEDGRLWLTELFGLTCGFSGTWAGPQRVRGLAVVDTSLGLFEGDGLEASAVRAADDRLSVTWTMAGGRLQLESDWQHDAATGVWRRADTLINTGPEPVTVYQCQARFTFTPGAYEYYPVFTRSRQKPSSFPGNGL